MLVATQGISPSGQNWREKMFNLPLSFTQGASFIKKNQQQFKKDCLEMSTIPAIHESVKAELVAASKADKGATNTGLNEKGWRAFAEVIGMTSPKSTKLIVPVGVNPDQYKQECLVVWLLHGVYSSSRVDGRGGSRAIKDDVELFSKGLLAKGSRKQVQVRPVPHLETNLFDDVSGDI